MESVIAEYNLVVAGSYFGNKTFPGFNQYMHMHFSEQRKSKADSQKIINNAIRLQLKRLKIDSPIALHFVYFEPDAKRDLDNIAGTAHKFIIDSLVQCGVIENDSQKYVRSMTDKVFIDKGNPRIEVRVEVLG